MPPVQGVREAFREVTAGCLLLDDVDCLGAFRALLDIIADGVALVEGLEPAALNG